MPQVLCMDMRAHQRNVGPHVQRPLILAELCFTQNFPSDQPTQFREVGSTFAVCFSEPVVETHSLAMLDGTALCDCIFLCCG